MKPCCFAGHGQVSNPVFQISQGKRRPFSVWKILFLVLLLPQVNERQQLTGRDHFGFSEHVVDEVALESRLECGVVLGCHLSYGSWRHLHSNRTRGQVSQNERSARQAIHNARSVRSVIHNVRRVQAARIAGSHRRHRPLWQLSHGRPERCCNFHTDRSVVVGTASGAVAPVRYSFQMSFFWGTSRLLSYAPHTRYRVSL